MYLVIDISNASNIIFHYSFDDGEHWQKAAQQKIAGELGLLKALDQVLQMADRTVHSITHLGLIMGKNTFTETRIAATLANTLAFALHSSIVNLSSFDSQRTAGELREGNAGQYALALYSGEPRIGGKRNEV